MDGLFSQLAMLGSSLVLIRLCSCSCGGAGSAAYIDSVHAGGRWLSARPPRSWRVLTGCNRSSTWWPALSDRDQGRRHPLPAAAHGPRARDRAGAGALREHRHVAARLGRAARAARLHRDAAARGPAEPCSRRARGMPLAMGARLRQPLRDHQPAARAHPGRSDSSCSRTASPCSRCWAPTASPSIVEIGVSST